MEIMEILTIVSSVAAAVAALAAWRTAHLTNKQFIYQQNEMINKYKPIFKIKGSYPQPNGYLFDIQNIGFPFYSIAAINWNGEYVEIENDFNGTIEKSSSSKNNSPSEPMRDTLAIAIKIEPKANTEGFLEINGVDLNQNTFSLKSPLIIIKNGKISNGIKVTHQFLK